MSLMEARFFNDVLSPSSFQDARVEERRWGYVLNAANGFVPRFDFMQRIALLFGAGLALSGSGNFWMMMASDIGIFGGAAGLIMLSLSALLLWYASRGTEAYICVNLYRGELREVVPNHIGRPTILRRLPFADIGGVRIERSGVGGQAMLMLRCCDEWRQVAVLDGSEAELNTIRERLARDVFLSDVAA